MKIKMTRSVSGRFHGREGGVRAGEVVDIDEQNALRYIYCGAAEYADPPVSREDAMERVERARQAVQQYAARNNVAANVSR